MAGLIVVGFCVLLLWHDPLVFWNDDYELSVLPLFAALHGWIICWGATDWFGALGAFAWLPWAWWSLEGALDRQRTRWRFLWPAPFVYLVVTGGFPYTVLMLALLIAWLAIKSLAETKSWMSILPM